MGRKRETPAAHRRLHPLETARHLSGCIRPPLAGFESWVISLITHSCENSSLIPAFILCRAGARRSLGCGIWMQDRWSFRWYHRYDHRLMSNKTKDYNLAFFATSVDTATWCWVIQAKSLISTIGSPERMSSIAFSRDFSSIALILRFEVFPQVIQIIWGGGPNWSISFKKSASLTHYNHLGLSGGITDYSIIGPLQA